MGGIARVLHCLPQRPSMPSPVSKLNVAQGCCCIGFDPTFEAAAQSAAVVPQSSPDSGQSSSLWPGQKQAQGLDVISDAAIQLNTKGESLDLVFRDYQGLLEKPVRQ